MADEIREEISLDEVRGISEHKPLEEGTYTFTLDTPAEAEDKGKGVYIRADFRPIGIDDDSTIRKFYTLRAWKDKNGGTFAPGIFELRGDLAAIGKSIQGKGVKVIPNDLACAQKLATVFSKSFAGKKFIGVVTKRQSKDGTKTFNDLQVVGIAGDSRHDGLDDVA